MQNTIIKREIFKKALRQEVKDLFRVTLEEASPRQIYQAVCYVVKDQIIDNWMKTQKAMAEQDPKIVYYMSMEFLTGRYLGNNLLALTAYEEVKKALSDLGIDLILKSGGKVAGIRHVIEREGIRPEECIAFGDAENDIEMLEYCGIGVAMGNAQDQVKKIADHVTSSVDDDGIRNALRSYGIV